MIARKLGLSRGRIRHRRSIETGERHSALPRQRMGAARPSAVTPSRFIATRPMRAVLKCLRDVVPPQKTLGGMHSKVS